MNILQDGYVQLYFGGIAGVLFFASAVGWFLKSAGKSPETIKNLNQRVLAWWGMVAIVFVAVLAGPTGAVVLFGLISFLALREFVTLFPTRRADHRALFWAFFVITPLQYYLVQIRWYPMMTILIPVYGFIFLAIRAALAGDATDFLNRTAKIQWAMMVCVYSISHIPALMLLDTKGGTAVSNVKLMLFLLLVVQMSDVFQYVFGKLFGKHPVAPKLSPKKTIEGLIGGVAAASLLGTLLHGMTPFNFWQAGLISVLITSLGFFGGLVMSAIKRGQGVKDYGAILPGHGGIMDRIDSLCFSAPVFFHVIRYYFT